MGAEKKSFVLDEDLITFVEAGVPIIVGTCDADNRPSVTRGWAARVIDSGRGVVFFLSNAQSGPALADLRGGGRIAATFSRPCDYRTFQLKGHCTNIEALDDRDDLDARDQEDLRYVERYWEALVVSLAGIGVPEALSRSMWADGLTRVTFTIERCYRQTPGPNAGEELSEC